MYRGKKPENKEARPIISPNMPRIVPASSYEVSHSSIKYIRRTVRMRANEN